jgi:hypothetical protein
MGMRDYNRIAQDNYGKDFKQLSFREQVNVFEKYSAEIDLDPKTAVNSYQEFIDTMERAGPEKNTHDPLEGPRPTEDSEFEEISSEELQTMIMKLEQELRNRAAS